MNTVSASYLASFLESCIKLGASKNELLALIPSMPADVEQTGDTTFKMSQERYSTDLIFKILTKAEYVTRQPEIGLLCGQNLRPAALNEIGNAILCCKSLRQVILINRRYQMLTQQMGRTNLKINNDHAKLLWEPYYTDPEYGRMITDVVMAGHAIFGRWLLWVHDKKIIAVHFRHAKPSYAKKYVEIFDCPVLFGQEENAMLIDIDAIDAPLPQANETALAEICGRLDIALAEMEPAKPYHVQVADLLRREIQNGLLNLDQTASRIGISPRGLRRNLTAEKTSFSKVLKKTRRGLCEKMLLAEMPLLQISGQLGYSQQSAFNRAFKEWFGTTPKAYVKAQKTAGVAFDQLAP